MNRECRRSVNKFGIFNPELLDREDEFDSRRFFSLALRRSANTAGMTSGNKPTFVGMEQRHCYRDSLLVRAPDSRSKGCEFESRQERRGNFLLQSQLCVLTLILCPFHPRVTAVACKRPRSIRQNCRWQVTPKHEYAFDPTKSEWADYAAVQA